MRGSRRDPQPGLFSETPAAGLGLAGRLVARGLGAGARQRGPDPHNFQAVGFLGLDLVKG